MRDINAFSAPQSQPETSKDLHNRLFDLTQAWERKSFERHDILRLLRAGKIEEFQREYREAKFYDLAYQIGIKLRVLKLKTKQAMLKKKEFVLKTVKEARRKQRPFWADEAEQVKSANHLTFDLDLDFTSDRVLEEAWSFVMGQL